MSLLYIAPLVALLVGSIVYCILAVVAAARYMATRVPPLPAAPPVSVLRPLAGAEDNTEANLRSLFTQRYGGPFEVLLAVHEDSDPALAIARRVMAEFPGVASRIVLSGRSPEPNAKVWSLRALFAEARHEVLIMSDSDISIPQGGFTTMVAELSQPNVAMVTCPYRAVAGRSLWSKLEALGLNTEFLGGLLTARMLGGVDFAIGCTIAARKADLTAIGGFERLQRYLAEDFVMGNLTHRRGRTVILSRCIIDHHIGGNEFLKNWGHRLRWARSTRRSRPYGYLGELFTKTTAIGLMLAVVAKGGLGFAIIGWLFRICFDAAMGIWVLDDPLVERYWWLLPVEELASFLTWVLGFFGNTITWRGRRLTVARDGSFEL